MSDFWTVTLTPGGPAELRLQSVACLKNRLSWNEIPYTSPLERPPPGQTHFPFVVTSVVAPPCESGVIFDARCTSTAANFYTALKVMSKTHFYGRAAPEAILAVDLTALLPPCSGGDIFSDPVPSKAAECARKSPSAKSDSGDRIGREGHQLAPTGRAECPHRSHLPVEGIRADAGPCQRSRLVDCLGRPGCRGGAQLRCR